MATQTFSNQLSGPMPVSPEPQSNRFTICQDRSDGWILRTYRHSRPLFNQKLIVSPTSLWITAQIVTLRPHHQSLNTILVLSIRSGN